jgi:isochorismate hydrolase
VPIPPIAPYEMPTVDQVAPNRAHWRPDAQRAVLLIHDMQRYFVAGFTAGTQPRTSLVANIVALRTAARAAGMPVVYTAQPGGMSRRDRGLLRDFWGPGMTTSAVDRQIIDELAPEPADVVLTKWRYSAFHRSRLADLLRRGRRDQLIVSGVYAHVGCLMTACEAFSRDIETFLPIDGVADFSRREHLLTLDYAAQRCAVTLPTADIAASLAARTDAHVA